MNRSSGITPFTLGKMRYRRTGCDSGLGYTHPPSAEVPVSGSDSLTIVAVIYAGVELWATERDFIQPYPAGSRGPREATRLLNRDDQDLAQRPDRLNPQNRSKNSIL